MSDLEKVHSYAVKLGSNTPIQLRWEGAGDSVHAAKLLGSLKNRTYPGTSTLIKYHAVINIYESETSHIYGTALSVLNSSLRTWVINNSQTYEVHANADVTRGSGTLNQPKAHVIFVRNIMPTNDSEESLTNAGDVLMGIHQGALRNRSNSIEDGGSLRLGMSGAPGLASASHNQRVNMPVKNFFKGAKSLVGTADESGLKVEGLPTRTGLDDYDEGGVMKNNGVDLGIKKTFYLTFVK